MVSPCPGDIASNDGSAPDKPSKGRWLTGYI
jgi:hypothetical protein